jgi:hypothetical protein
MQARLVVEDLAVDHDFIRLVSRIDSSPWRTFVLSPTSDMLSACCAILLGR